MLRDREKLEYAVSQYLDGTLNAMDRRVLEEQLAADAEARVVLDDYRRLNDWVMSSARESIPAIDFDKLAAHLSQQIDEEPAHTARPLAMPIVWLRRMAIAAGVVMAIGVGMHFVPKDAGSPSGSHAAGTMVVVGPTAEANPASGSIKIAVGPADALRERGVSISLIDEAITPHAPHVVISAADQPVLSSDDRLY